MKQLNMTNMTTAQLLKPTGYDCPCGRHHAAPVRDIIIGEHVLDQVIPMAKARNMTYPLVVSDQNTYKAAGESVLKLLSDAHIEHAVYTMDTSHPTPSEYWVGAVAMRYNPRWDGIIGVGSGVINDICKIISNNTQLPFIIVGTAPSMDGYASDTSSMVLAGLKSTIPSRCASGIIADTAILSQAPMRMLQSGFGDMAAKYTSICEWRISHLINGEYYCEEIASLVRKSLRQCTDSSHLLPQRNPEVVGHVMNGLILSGISMSYAGISRPASGTEHYLSHIWDMTALEQGYEHDMHGIQCGVGTLLTLKIYDYIKTLKPDREKALAYVRDFSTEEWEANIRHLFGSAANSIIRLEQKEQKYNQEAHARRLEVIIAHWDEILGIIHEELPSYQWMYDKLKETGAPVLPEELKLSRELVRDSFLCTKDIRDKYISTRLLWDLGVLDEAAQQLF